jgi:hypothetical protein
MGFGCQSNNKVRGAITWRIERIADKLVNPCPESPGPALENLGHAGHALSDSADVPPDDEYPF